MSENIEPKSEKSSKPKPKFKNSQPSLSWKVLVVIVLIVVSLSVSFIIWQNIQNSRDQSPEAVAARNEEESTRIVTEVSLILFTESEDEPTVARIDDPDVLRQANAEFYKNAAEGDYLILYPQRAIIYREDENIVINVAPIINSSQITPETEQ